MLGKNFCGFRSMTGNQAAHFSCDAMIPRYVFRYSPIVYS